MTTLLKELEIPAISDINIKNALAKFVEKDSAYKSQFLQSNYQTAFDGYSFIGQKDSLNQYETDMLHSFVLSEFQDLEKFPEEFHPFLQEEWGALVKNIRAIELSVIEKLQLPELKRLYEEDVIGYMMSCNYYPKPMHCDVIAANNTRLSAHKDVSLFSTFPYGVAKGLSYYNDKQELIKMGDVNTMMLFSGYFLEFTTNNLLTALDHQVDLPQNANEERFSFAIFSIPKPNSSFLYHGKEISSTDYYKAYLSLF